MSDRNPRLSVVVALHDEVVALPELYLQLTGACDALGRTYELLFVDDGSRDGSGPMLDALVDEDARVRVLHLRRNYGKEAALAVGFASARGEVVVTLDPDLQDDPAMISDFLARIDGGADVVTGWPQRPKYPAIARLQTALVRRFVGVDLHDLDCGLRAYRGAALRELGEHHGAERLLPVLAHARGLRVEELVVNHREPKHERIRARDHRRARLAQVFEVIGLAGRLRPLRVLVVPGTIVAASGLIVLLLFGLIVPAHFMTGTWLALGLLLAIFGGQLIVGGLVAEMILGRDRPAPQHAILGERESEADELMTRSMPAASRAGLLAPPVEELRTRSMPAGARPGVATPSAEELRTRSMAAGSRTAGGTLVAPVASDLPDSDDPLTRSMPAGSRTAGGTLIAPISEDRPITYSSPVLPMPPLAPAEPPGYVPVSRTVVAPAPSGPATEQMVGLRLPQRPNTASNPAVEPPNPLDVEIDDEEGPATIAVDRNPFYRPPQ